uniref:NFAM1 Ig-like domain-containing protein n=1 Tax=Dromaius novaehollandiae TaxID=8790 RepID=A0A8C4J9H7_DRONO
MQNPRESHQNQEWRCLPVPYFLSLSPSILIDVRWLLTIITLAGGQVNVQQRPPIRVALLKEEVSIPCKVTFPYIMKYTKFSVFYYWINLVGKKTFIYSKSVKIQIPPGEENRTTTQSYDHKTTPLESTSFTGTYYCEVKWDHIVKVGSGVFVLARGK